MLFRSTVTVVHNGVDTSIWQPSRNEDAIRRLGVDPDRPYVLFVGRITRQKGLTHLLRAAHRFPDGVQIVLAASSPDEPNIGTEVEHGVAELSAKRPGDVVWLNTSVPKPDLITLLTHASVFLCPSVYEPLGIVNLEAMACSTAVIASDVGGIPEVVVNGETGLLVHYDQTDPQAFEQEFGRAINELIADPARARLMGDRGRERAIAEFGWDIVAKRTLEVYATAGAVPGAPIP